MTNAQQFAQDVYDTVDAMDATQFAAYFTPEATFSFGNNPTVQGREAIAATIESFFSMIQGLSHTITGVWAQDDIIIVRVSIDYARKDGQVVTLPAVSIWTMKDGLIDAYDIYMDVNPVFA